LNEAEVQDVKDRAKLLYKRFYPCYTYAFTDAADIGLNGRVGGTKTATKDHYVQRSEFRFLTVYLCLYALMYDAFSVVDGRAAGVSKDDDRRISLKEFELAVNKGYFTGHPLVGVRQLEMVEDAESLYKEMDSSDLGQVVVGEWCAYMEKKEVENGTELGKLLTVAIDGTVDGDYK